MRVAYICEGGAKLGWGHVGRARALLEALGNNGAMVLGAGYDEIKVWSQSVDIGFPITRWKSRTEPVVAKEYDVLVVDHYSLSSEWIETAQSIRPVLLVDDWIRKTSRIAALVNPNIGARRSDYTGIQATYWGVGAEYALLRREVKSVCAEPLVYKRSPSQLLLTLGGSDPGGCTAVAAKEIIELPWFREGGLLTVVLGASYSGPTPWKTWTGEWTQRVDVVQQPTDFLWRCATADVVVSGAGTTTYELAYLGRPFVPVALVDNQVRIAHEWSLHGIGTDIRVWDTTWRRNLCQAVTSLLASQRDRETLGKRAKKFVDGRGVERLVDLCGSLIK